MTHATPDTALRSMTGFATRSADVGPFRWTWDIRSVNGKGLDLRLRVPDWIDGLEAAIRPMAAAHAKRGNITLSVRVTRDDATATLGVNAAQMRAAVHALLQIEAEAMDQGLSLAPSRASDIAAMRGVLEQTVEQDDPTELRKAMVADLPAVLEAFDAMRVAEGRELHKVLSAQLDEIETLTRNTATVAEARRDAVAANLKRNLSRVLESAEGVDPDRVAQELALLAVKADVTEEIDRLLAHVSAARTLLSEGRAIGRKLDFLMQEFNREANTLCSKAQDTELTRIGLALKALIDQMREQVQNVE